MNGRVQRSVCFSRNIKTYMFGLYWREREFHTSGELQEVVIGPFPNDLLGRALVTINKFFGNEAEVKIEGDTTMFLAIVTHDMYETFDKITSSPAPFTTLLHLYAVPVQSLDEQRKGG